MKTSDVADTVPSLKRLRSMVKARSTGPSNFQGKAISALNAIKHGLAAKQVLLPGEDPEEYAQRADAVFEALAPKDDAQAEIVALVADDLHKLARLERVETGILLGRIEVLMAQTETGEAANRVGKAIQAVGAALAAWSAVPMPAERGEDLDRRSKRLREAFSTAMELVPDLPVEPYANCNRDLTRLADKVAHPAFPADLLVKVYEEAWRFLEEAVKVGKGVEARQETLRKAVATISLPDNGELSKLAKYRRLIEEGLSRRLLMLEQVRKLTMGTTATDAEKAAAKEYRLRLRVVS